MRLWQANHDGRCGGLTKAVSEPTERAARAMAWSKEKTAMVEDAFAVRQVHPFRAMMFPWSCMWMSLDATEAVHMLQQLPQPEGASSAAERFPIAASRAALKRLSLTPLM